MTLPDNVLGAGSALEDALFGFIDEGRTGIAIRVPESLPVSNVTHPNRGILLAGCCIETLGDAARRPSFRTMALLVAAQLETGRVRAGRAFAETAEGLTLSAPADAGEGYTGGAFRINVATRLGLPRIPGPIAVWLIARDRAAGPARVFLEDSSVSGVEDREVARFLARRRQIVKPLGVKASAVWPRETFFGKYPIYRKVAESPVMPEKGISLWTKDKASLSDEVCVLAGSFRVPIPARQVVRQPLSGDPTTAVVPITLVMTSDMFPGPSVRHLRVPSYASIDPDAPQPIAEGYFKFNLVSFFGLWRPARRVFVYAVCGDVLSRPEEIRIQY